MVPGEATRVNVFFIVKDALLHGAQNIELNLKFCARRTLA